MGGMVHGSATSGAADDFEDEDDSIGYMNVIDDEDDDSSLRDRCVLGDRCCCPHIFHTADECFDAEWAESYYADAEQAERDAANAPLMPLAEKPAPN